MRINYLNSHYYIASQHHKYDEFIGGLGENRTLDLCHVKATS